MMGKTHIAVGLTAGLGLCLIAHPTPDIALPTIGAALIGSLLPDIDTAHSKIGCRVPLLSWILRIFFGHRQFFHSLVCWVIVTALIWLCGGHWLVCTGFGIGTISHLFLDMLNPSGVQLLWPKDIRISIAKIRCGGLCDCMIALFCSAMAIWLGYIYLL